MATCNHCGTTIVFGGTREGGFRFCNTKCRDASILLSASTELPEGFVAEKVLEVHQGNCPKCGGPGPVDVHTAHSLWSAIFVTTWRSTPHVCCASCGNKARLLAMLSTGVFGWWGFPFGVVGTPIQILRNVGGMMGARGGRRPSEALGAHVRAQLAVQLLEEDQQALAETPATPAPIAAVKA